MIYVFIINMVITFAYLIISFCCYSIDHPYLQIIYKRWVYAYWHSILNAKFSNISFISLFIINLCVLDLFLEFSICLANSIFHTVDSTR